jgi:hypothetical protein
MEEKWERERTKKKKWRSRTLKRKEETTGKNQIR